MKRRSGFWVVIALQHGYAPFDILRLAFQGDSDEINRKRAEEQARELTEQTKKRGDRVIFRAAKVFGGHW